MISPLLFGREGAEASLRHCQHKPPPCWFKHQWNSHSAQVSLAASKAKKLCSKSAKNRHLQNMKKCQLNNNNVVYWFLITEHPRVPPAPLPPTPTVCLSVHLSTSIPHFFFFRSPCQLFSKSPSVHVCLSVSVSSFHSLCLLYLRANIQQKPQLSLIPTPSPPASLIFPLLSLFLLVWVDGNKQPASPGLPAGLISAGGAAELRQIDDKACQGSSLLFKDRLHLKAHAPCG